MGKVRHRRVTSWIAIFAILLNAFAPSIAHALASSNAAPWLEVCTDGGRVKPAASRDQGEQPSKSATSAQHCPLCVPQGVSFAAPPAALNVVVVDADRECITTATSQVRLPSPWRTARSRAPPAP